MAGEKTTVYTARRVITMDPDLPSATAVAVSGNRIAAVGDLDNLRSAGVVDDRFADAVICPGLIDQHLHPILGATTLMTEVIAIEDWPLPGRTYPAAHSEQEYRDRLTAAHRSWHPTDGCSPGATTSCGTARWTAPRWMRSAQAVRSWCGSARATNGSSTPRPSRPSG